MTEEDTPRCEGEESHGDRPAAFRFAMLDTTSLDGVVDLCFECAWEMFREWAKDPADVAGYEVRTLPIAPPTEPRVILLGGLQ